MIEKFKTNHKGVDYTHIRCKKPVAGVACIGDKRTVIQGMPKFSITNGSWKFGKELQISICSPKLARIEEGRNEGSAWNTLEINMPLEIGQQIIDTIKEELDKDDVKKS